MSSRAIWVDDPHDADIVGEQTLINLCGGGEERVPISVADRRHQLSREVLFACAEFLAHRGTDAELRAIVEGVIAARHQEITKHPHLAGLPILRRADGSMPRS